MNVLALISCHHCGGPLKFNTEGGNNYERRAALVCPHCQEPHVLIVRLAPTKGIAA